MLADLLIECGMDRRVAKVLAYLSEVEKATSREIEINLGMRQPEVSLTMKKLKELGWVSVVVESKKSGKGRPQNVYILNCNIKEIIKEFIREKREEIQELNEKLGKLEEIIEKY